MAYVLDPAAHEIWDRQQQDKLSADDWRRLDQYSTILVLSAIILSSPTIGSQFSTNPQWVAAVEVFRTAAENTLLSAKRQDKAALAKGADQLLSACESCHTQFRLNVPTEGKGHLPQLPFN